MKPKMMIKISIDFMMTVLLLLLMAFNIVGEELHEWLGLSMFILFIAHTGLNAYWYKHLFKGRYTIHRRVQITINLAVFADMIGLMISGIMMSRYVFGFLPIRRYMYFARQLHMMAAYWGFVLMSLHLGMHWQMLITMFEKIPVFAQRNKVMLILNRVIACVIAGYGAYAFMKYDLLSYLLLKVQFAFFDDQQSIFSFMWDYLCIMGFGIFVIYYIGKIFKYVEVRKGEFNNGENADGN